MNQTYYPHLMSPLKLRDSIVQSRLLFPNALPHFQQGPETYPADPVVTFYTNLAKNGTGLIFYHHTIKQNLMDPDRIEGDEPHFPAYDISDPKVWNYICQLNDNIHYYGGLTIVDMFYQIFRDKAVIDSSMIPEEEKNGPAWMRDAKQTAFTEEDIDAYIEKGIHDALFLKSLGFNAGQVELSRYSVLGSFMSPLKNRRTDEYGGSLENRMRFPLKLLKRLRQAMGDDFIIMAECTYEDEYCPAPFEDMVELLKQAAPYIDLLHVRNGQRGTGYVKYEEDYLKPKALAYSEKLKAAGVSTPIAAWTGFVDPALMDKAIAEGKCDMISTGRQMIANPHFGELVSQGRGDEVVPCILCNKCHGISLHGDWMVGCSVNPELGIHARVHRMVKEPGEPKRIAIIGGGPAGMLAAKYTIERGHHPTVFESSDALGGQLKFSKYPRFKWPLRRYMEYLIHEMDKLGVDVRLNTRATPEMIKEGGFDVVIAATGAVPKKPNIPGAESTDWNTWNIYGSEEKLGSHVVCIGGSESSAEGATYLADCGHKVTLLSRKSNFGYDATPIHYLEELRAAFYSHDNVEFIPNADTVKIEKGRVTYRDEQGAEHTIECDDVVAAGGMQANAEAALAFYGSAPEFYTIGDGKKVGDVRKCNRDAFAIASQL